MKNKINFSIIGIITFFFIVFSNNLLSQEIDDCSNFYCDDTTLWSRDVNVLVPSLACPDCIYRIRYDWRVVNCMGNPTLQVQISYCAGSNLACYTTCNFASSTELLEDALLSFMEWCGQNELFAVAEILQFYNAPCWAFTPTSTANQYEWYRCTTNACCIWTWERSPSGELINPVLTEPDFYECQYTTIPEFPVATYCYPICGLINPINYYKYGLSDNYITVTRPQTMPNPNHGIFELATMPSAVRNVIFEIYTLDGNIVETATFESNEKGKYKLNLSQLSSGNYFYNIMINERYVSFGNKLIIKK